MHVCFQFLKQLFIIDIVITVIIIIIIPYNICEKNGTYTEPKLSHFMQHDQMERNSTKICLSTNNQFMWT